MGVEEHRYSAELWETLKQMGFSEEKISMAIESGNSDVNAAIAYMCDVTSAEAGTGGENRETKVVEGVAGLKGSEDDRKLERKVGPIVATKDEDTENLIWKPTVPDAKDVPRINFIPTQETADFDDEFKRAIELSKMQASVDAPKVDDANDEQLQRIISESLQSSRQNSSAQWPTQLPEDPRERSRSSREQAVGLRNIGNTCYLNSLLQLYYSLADFRRAIFKFRRKKLSAEEVGQQSEGTEQAVKFVEELQALFASMALGPEKYVDPTRVIEALRGPDGRKIEVGGQQDVSEFNHLLLDVVERAFASCESVKAGEVNPARQLFTSQFVQEITMDDACEDVSTSETNSIIINVASSAKKNIHWGLDEYAHASVEYRKEAEPDEIMKDAPPYKQSEVKKAVKRVWFTKLAPVVMVYTSRVRFNRETKIAEKVHDYLALDEEVAFDRYLSENKVAAEKARSQATAIRKRRSELLDNLRAYQYIGVDGEGENSGDTTEVAMRKTRLRMEKALVDAGHFGLADVSEEDVRNCKDILDRIYKADILRIESSKAEAERLLAEERNVYSNLSSKKYRLFAVLVHSGAASSGHYLTYIRTFPRHGASELSAPVMFESNETAPSTTETDKGGWTRFDDMNVKEATISDVKNDSEGGDTSHNSAYGLVYISNDLEHEIESGGPSKEAFSLLPSHLIQQMSQRQQDFEKLVDSYKKEQEAAAYAKEANAVIQRASSILIAAQTRPSQTRLKNRVEFLYAVIPAKNDLIFVQALTDAYSPTGDFVTDCVKASMPPLGTPQQQSELSLINSIISACDFSTTNVAGGERDFLVDGFVAARKVLVGPGLIDAQEELDTYNNLYAAALRKHALFKCACDATVSGIWLRGIALWSHVLRQTYSIGSNLKPEIFRKYEQLQISPDQYEFGFTALGVLLIVATETSIEALNSDSEEILESVAATGEEIQACVCSFFDKDSNVFSTVSVCWHKAAIQAGEPKELQKIVNGYDEFESSVSIRDLVPFDDDAQRDINAVEERARDFGDMSSFVQRYEKSFGLVEEMFRNTNSQFALLETASKLRQYVRNST